MASGGLATIGVVSLKAADKRQKMLAAIPFFFAIQQAVEGFQWISLNAGKPSMTLAYTFLFFAFLFWPTYMPLTIFKLEPKRKKLLGFLLMCGVVISCFLLWALLSEPLSVYVRGSSICYDINFPFGLAISTLYVVVTCGVLLFSSNKFMNWVGLLVLLSAIISEIFFYYVFISVWCFFAAIISSLVYLYIKYPKIYASSLDKYNLA
ncbi:MAG: hypothetical protein HY226_03545 [Candidatus Vogelbacteria bacterium]|nr:hypothetical protein [Candidatus Vogelbacteria bacterium]